MAWTTMGDVAASSQLTSTMWNATIDNINYLYNTFTPVSYMTVVAATAAGNPVTWTSASVDDLGAFNVPNAYLAIPTTGYYEMAVLQTLSGATGTITGQLLQINRNNSSNTLIEVWAGNQMPAINTTCSAAGAGQCDAGDRIRVNSTAAGNGTAGTVATRGVLLRRK